MKKLDHRMYKSFLAIQLHGLKTDNEQVYKLFRLLTILKSHERDYKNYNKACGFDMIQKVPSKSLSQMVSKSAFKRLNGVISIWNVVEKNVVNTERRVLKLLQKDNDQLALDQYKLLSNLVDLLEQNEAHKVNSIKKESFDKIVMYFKAKREKYAHSALQLTQTLQESYQKEILLKGAFTSIKQFLQNKTLMYTTLVSEKGPLANLSLESFLKKI